MSFFQTELEKMTQKFEDKKFLNDCIYVNLDENRKLKIHFSDVGHSGNFGKLRVTLKDKNVGDFDQWDIYFANIFDSKDDRCYAWSYRGPLDWYIYRPTDEDYLAMSEHLYEYFELYMDQAPEQNIQMGGI